MPSDISRKVEDCVLDYERVPRRAIVTEATAQLLDDESRNYLRRWGIRLEVVSAQELENLTDMGRGIQYPFILCNNRGRITRKARRAVGYNLSPETSPQAFALMLAQAR
ncbi:hypothetical protein FJZ19_05680 [Candidatus Pacearchaeota archaeon]|nr:hypothetical protein [Candidatus Pacearchaeota archaeon]